MVGAHRLPDRPWSPSEAATSRSPGLFNLGEALDAGQWDRALSAIASPAPLNQSWAWGEVQASAGWKPKRVYLSGLGPVLVLVQSSGPLRWGYVPRGPAGCTDVMLKALIEWSRRAGLARLRIEPQLGPEVRPLLSSAGFERVKDVQPSHTRIVCLQPDAEMLATFRRTTRYNIAYAERNRVLVEESAEAGELAHHVRASAARAGVNLPGREYFELLLQRLPICRTFVARHDADSLCALLVAVHDGRGYYLYSGSTGLKRNLKAMDLCMWRAMQYAARRGCRDYDLWGIAPTADRAHPWYGFSEFKRGYGGESVEYAGTWELGLSTVGRLAVRAQERARQAYRGIRAGAGTHRAA